MQQKSVSFCFRALSINILRIYKQFVVAGSSGTRSGHPPLDIISWNILAPPPDSSLDNFQSLLTWCGTFPSSANLQYRPQAIIPLTCTKLTGVDRLGSGVRVSARFQTFALTAGECSGWNCAGDYGSTVIVFACVCNARSRKRVVAYCFTFLRRCHSVTFSQCEWQVDNIHR